MKSKVIHSIEPSTFTGIIGVAEVDITPPIGIYTGNWGAAKQHVATGIHSPLYLTCLTLQDSDQNQPLVMISMDLGWWKDGNDEKRVRAAVLSALNLSEENLMICLTHTHAGPSICSGDINKPGGDHIERYLSRLEDAMIKAISQAIGTAKRSTLTWQYGSCDLAKNRDMSDIHQDRMLVGYNAEVEADNTLLVGRVTDEDHTTRAILVNYACHPTTLAWENTEISPDYIGAMRALLRKETGAICLFLQGASGELSPIVQYVGQQSVADQHGRMLGYAVLSTLEAMPRANHQLSLDGVVESGAPLAVWKEKPISVVSLCKAYKITVTLPLKSMPIAAELQAQYEAETDAVLKERLWRKLCIRRAIGDGFEMESSVWIWKLGSSYLVGQSNETYSIFQQRLRQIISPHTIAVMNLVNGSVGYLPPQSYYDKNVYSVWQTPFEKGSLEILMDQLAITLDSIKNRK
ncbi:neutral/alkaline non-lysosomal ceramidase N-terminal domain-containing protein [Membranihabitans marinus]|uniref:neutral/alkaline non-lysosomal ceramidase N-terminal domain-containing protein n=1 Tax=Membranihabitans marinus TaxID=1227546 RepID=UPI001F1A58C1|nr:neutral/alkaline non-lysosomal ceramidase N-terminal domain-containing protein [Membranihabitans marinus]